MTSIPQQPIGESPAWLATLDQISGAAALDKPMLVIGERGTGKELVATRLHFLSPRWERDYIPVNCAALSNELLDSELFGHEAGAFTGAAGRRAGRFERANGGTLFLDEIAMASARVQEKLLRIIEYGEFERLGGNQTLKVDVRIIGATNVDLPTAVRKGKFRADLIDRLAFDVITLPPLRVRKTDILPLAEHFGRSMVADLGEESFPGFTPEVMEFLMNHDWPGNVRELKNVTERAVGRAYNEENGLARPIAQISIDPFDAPWRLSEVEAEKKYQSTENPEAPTPQGADFTARTHAFELGLIQEALGTCENHQGKAAKYLNLTYHQFRGLLRKHGLRK